MMAEDVFSEDNVTKATKLAAKLPPELRGVLKIDLDKATDYLLTNFYDLYSVNKTRLFKMMDDLLVSDLPSVMTWGEDSLRKQGALINEITDTIRVFNSLDGNKILDEVTEAAKRRSFMSMFVKAPSKQYYVLQIGSLTVRLKTVMEAIERDIDKCKSSDIPLWLASLASVSESANNKDDVIYDAMYNKRMTLQQALQSIEFAKQQLTQIQSMVVKMRAEIDTINHVILPSLNLLGVRK